MNCPRCKAGLASKQYENMTIENCAQCGGIWLDKGELQPILTARDIHFSHELVEKTLKEAHCSIRKADVSDLLACPKCADPMHALNYNYSSGVIINTCPNGHGVWFDKDELAEVQIFMEHWDDDEQQNQAKWMAIQQKARTEETVKMEQEEAKERSKMGPIGRTIDAILDRFSMLSNGKK